MSSPRDIRFRSSWLWIAWLVLGLLAPADSGRAQVAPGGNSPERRPAQFFTVPEPITDAVIEKLTSSVGPLLERGAARGVAPVLVFEFQASHAGGQTSAGNAADLAEFLSTRLGGADRVIAYVPTPLSGYAVLAALACDEIVLGEAASLGPITPDGQPVSEAARAVLETLARRKGRDPELLRGLLDPSVDLREVRTADRRTHFVPAPALAEFERENQVVGNEPAWEGGRRAVLTAERARSLNFTPLLVPNRGRLIATYGLASASDDPTLGGPVRPILIRIAGPIDAAKESYLRRRISQAVNEQRVNLIVLHLDSEGGLIDSSKRAATALAGLNRQGVKTVAVVDRALGTAALPALACDEIVMVQHGRLGGIAQTVAGRGQVEAIEPAMTKVLADDLEDLARAKGYPEAIARALVDPNMELVAASDNQAAGLVYIAADQAFADQARYQVRQTIKPVGDVLTLNPEAATELGLSRTTVASLGDWLEARGLKGIRADQPTWVDALVTTLNTPWMSWLLLFIGMFMLILELKLPGVGLPAIASAMAFLLFFWGHYLGGTADRLEILLFIVGLVCIALELFIFPGFGVFGVSGILMVLISVVMASHTFVWPTQEYEYRQMGRTLTQVTATIIGVVVAAVAVGRYFPSMPIFRHMILMPETDDAPPDLPPGKPGVFEGQSAMAYLVGSVGRTTSVCRPSGKARIGDQLYDVTADGFFIETDTPVEVVEVRGQRVFVRRL